MKPVSTSILEACLQQLITERGQAETRPEILQLRKAVGGSADLTEYIGRIFFLGNSVGMSLPAIHVALFTFGLEMGIRVSELMQLEEMTR